MLTINYNNTDYSLKLEEFAAPMVDITLLNGEYIWIGYYKPISNVSVELTDSVSSLANLTVEYEKASGFASVLNLIDRTNGLGNSGKISWEVDAGQVQSTRFGLIRYWYRLSVNVSTGLREYVGINVLFSDDADLEEAHPGISQYIPSGKTSLVNFHASARKLIVQELRKKYSILGKSLTQFDLLDNEEVREVSKYLTLALIFDWLSDAPGDKWDLKYKTFADRAYGILNNITLSIDTNDDGVAQDTEKASIQFVKVVRV